MKSLDEEVGFLTVRTSRQLSQFLTLSLKPYGITIEQWGVLKRLEKQVLLTQKQLAERSMKDHATLTKILDLLEKRLLIQRLPNPEDRRSFLIEITEKGISLKTELFPFVERVFTEVIDGIEADQLAIYQNVMNQLEKNIQQLTAQK